MKGQSAFMSSQRSLLGFTPEWEMLNCSLRQQVLARVALWPRGYR